jgi:hypothetical protein
MTSYSLSTVGRQKGLQRLFHEQRFATDVTIRNELVSFLSREIILDDSRNDFSNQEEIEKTVNDTLDAYFIKGKIPDRGTILRQVCNNLLLCLNATQYTSVNELTEAFNSFKVASKEKDPPIKVVEIIADVLYFRIPDVTQKSAEMKQHLAHYLFFAKVVLMKSDQQCRIVIDKDTLGDICHMTVKTKNALDEIIASARSSTGLVGGRTFKFESGLKGPASSLISAIRLFNKNSSVYKKLHKKPTTLQVLKDSLNNFFGLKEPGVSSFAQLFVKQTLALATRPNNALPAPFGLALKSENNAKTDEGLMARLGYVRINVDVNKVVKVSRLTYTVGENGKISDIGQSSTEKKDLPHDKHFHAAVKILLPYVYKGTESMKSQLNKSDTDLSINSREFYLRHSKQVDSYGAAYAFYSAHMKNKKKTKAASVIAAATKAANDCSDVGYINKKGTEYTSYMDLKLAYRRFFENLLGRRPSPAKRKSEDCSEDLFQPAEDTSTAVGLPQLKKSKLASISERDDAEMKD